jgi:hypothetical protein
MSSTQIAVLVVVLVVVVLVAVGAVLVSRRRALRNQFGPEYDRVVSERDNRADAEQELRKRQQRHTELELRTLDPFTRERYVAAWEDVQVRFVDAPHEAVGEADELVTRLMAEIGYPTGKFGERVAHLSVEHARPLDHYRKAHEINLANQRGQATTEHLRQALVHYRALFADLLGTEPVRHSDNTSGTDAAPHREGHPNAPRQ